MDDMEKKIVLAFALTALLMTIGLGAMTAMVICFLDE